MKKTAAKAAEARGKPAIADRKQKQASRKTACRTRKFFGVHDRILCDACFFDGKPFSPGRERNVSGAKVGEMHPSEIRMSEIGLSQS